MNFRRGVVREEPEINFIPLIDVLLVIVIFLLVTTSYNRFGELRVSLPTANTDQAPKRPKELVVIVSADNKYAINGSTVNFLDSTSFAEEMRLKAGDASNVTITIKADAKAEHQSVMNVLHAAKLAGFSSIGYAVESETRKK